MRSRVALLLALAGVLLACHTRTSSKLAPDAGMSMPPAIAPSAAVPPIPPPAFSEVKLDIQDQPFAEAALPAGKPIPIPGIYAGAVKTPPRWLAGDGRSVSVFDPSGKKLGTIDSAHPDDISEKAGVISGWQGKKGSTRAAVLRLEDGRVVIADAKLADGQPASDVRVWVSAKTDYVLVVGKSPDGRASYYAAWEDRTSPNLVLSKDALVRDGGSEWNASSGVWDYFVTEPERSGIKDGMCLRAHLGRDRGVCALNDDPKQRGRKEWIDGEWYVDYALARGDTGARVAPSHNGAMVVAALASPIRVLFALQGKDSNRVLELVGPDGPMASLSEHFSEGNSYVSTISQAQAPIVAESSLHGSDHRTSTYFIDLERAVVFRTPELDVAGQGRVGRQFLAVVRDKSEDAVVHVDLEAKSLRRIFRLKPCKGQYQGAAVSGTWLSLVCELQPDPHLFRFIHQWELLVDTRRARVFKTSLSVFDVLDDDRIVIGNEAVTQAEGPSSASGARLVELAKD